MAGFQGSGDDDDVVAAINMVPMIDVVLVLLIIFIVTASAIVKAAISVDLPKTATSESAARPPMSIIMSCREKQDPTEAADGQCSPGPVLVDGEAIVDLSTADATLDPLVQLVRTRVRQAAAEPPPDGKDTAPGLTVLITADKDIRFKHVVWMMDMLKNEKVASIMFNSELFTRGENPRAVPR